LEHGITGAEQMPSMHSAPLRQCSLSLHPALHANPFAVHSKLPQLDAWGEHCPWLQFVLG
jgi:hypothetical protein